MTIPAAVPRRRTPWWAWLMGASFLIWAAFGFTNSLMGIGGPGASIVDSPGSGALVQKVVPGKPLELAGVRAGDIVVAVDGQPIRSGHDWGEMAWQFESGKPFTLTIERERRQMQLTLLFPHGAAWETRTSKQWLAYGFSAALSLLYMSMGFIALFSRPRDPGAVAGAFLLLMFAGFLGPGSGAGTAAMFRQWPFILQLPAFVIDTLLGGYLVLLFAALYPRPVFRRRWILPVLLLPAFLAILNNVFRFYHRFYMPSQAISPGPPWAFQLQLAVEIANIMAGLIVLVIGFRRLKEASDRRSMRGVLVGTLISFGAMMFYFWLLSSNSPFLQQVYDSKVTDVVLLVLWSVFPVVFATAVLRSAPRPASAVAHAP